MKKVFTTGQVAKICKVAPRTVSKWFDSGRLRGYRIPGSQDRRIPREHLIRFLKEHGMPLGRARGRGMAQDPHHRRRKALHRPHHRNCCPRTKTTSTSWPTSGFEAGIQAESFHPDTIIIDLAMGRSEALQIAQNLRRNPQYEATLIIALASEDEAAPEAAGQLRLQRSLQEAVRRRPAGRAHPDAGRRKARKRLIPTTRSRSLRRYEGRTPHDEGARPLCVYHRVSDASQKRGVENASAKRRETYSWENN